MTILGTFTQQPNEILSYDFDYSEWFAGRSDSPLSINVTADPGITIVGSQLFGNVVKVTLSGGTLDVRYKVTVRLTTLLGLVKEAEIYVRIKEF